MKAPLTAVPLAKGLRPIVFGSSGPPVAASIERSIHPELTLSVHRDDGDLLGYVVVDKVVAGATWGGLTIADGLSLDDLVVVARAATLQLRLFGIRRGSHHCLLRDTAGLTKSERAALRLEYLEALEPLTAAGLCQIAYTLEEGATDPSVAHRGACRSATATVLAALEHLGIPAFDATVALYRPWGLGEDVLAALCGYGLESVGQGEEALRAGADVLVVDGPLWSFGGQDVAAIRARTVVSLAPVAGALSAEQELHARGVLLVPDALATAGRFVALELRARGAEDRFALERTFSLVGERARALLTLAARRRRSFAGFVRASTSVQS